MGVNEVVSPVLAGIPLHVTKQVSLRDTIGRAWQSRRLYADGQGRYRAELSPSATGFTASMLEFTYPDVRGYPQIYTTSVFVTPDRFPYGPRTMPPLGAILLLLD